MSDRLLQEAVRLQWLTEEAARDSATAEAAVDAGQLDAGDLDVLKSLAGERQVAPGYVVTGLLGRGGMGVVYEAQQTALGRPVALKTVSLGGREAESLRRFEREAKALAQLSHPGIVSAFDFGRHDGRLFLAMELVRGSDLRDAIDAGPMPEAEVWPIIRQVAAALDFASSRGIVHRDVKPANILLVSPERAETVAKVADFGLASFSDAETGDRLTSRNVTVGSPAYMAPELLTGGRATAATDLYALGATAYHALTGRSPFAGLTLAGVVGQKTSGVVPEAENVSPASRRLLAAMMATRPEDRPANFATVIDAIDRMVGRDSGLLVVGDTSVSGVRAIDDTLILARDRGPRPRLSTRRRALLAAAGVAAAVTGWTFWPTRTGRAFPAMQESGPRRLLFDGRTLDGWSLEGEWRPGQTAEGDVAIVATSGYAVRRLPVVVRDADERQRVDWFRLGLAVDSPADAWVRISFGHPAGRPPEEGHAAAFAGRDWSVTTRKGSVAAEGRSRKSMHSLTLDYGPAGWRVRVNGRDAAVLPSRGPIAPEVQIAVDEGPGFILEPTLTPLSAAASPE